VAAGCVLDQIRIKQQVYLILQHDNELGHGAILEHSKLAAQFIDG